MKKLIISVAVLASLLSTPMIFADEVKAAPENVQVKCKYSLLDAVANLKTLEVNGFAPQKTFNDGMTVLGLVLYHNPANANKESVDAAVLVMADKGNLDSNQVILSVMYLNTTSQMMTIFRRRVERVEDRQTLSQCFDKTTEKVTNK
jgi:hypothetical protein